MKLTVAGKRWSLPAGQNMALVVAGLLLGLSLAVRWQGTAAPPPDAPAARARAAKALRQSEQEQEQLKATIASLREELARPQTEQQAGLTQSLARQVADQQREYGQLLDLLRRSDAEYASLVSVNGAMLSARVQVPCTTVPAVSR